MDIMNMVDGADINVFFSHCHGNKNIKPNSVQQLVLNQNDNRVLYEHDDYEEIDVAFRVKALHQTLYTMDQTVGFLTSTHTVARYVKAQIAEMIEHLLEIGYTFRVSRSTSNQLCFENWSRIYFFAMTETATRGTSFNGMFLSRITEARDPKFVDSFKRAISPSMYTDSPVYISVGTHHTPHFSDEFTETNQSFKFVKIVQERNAV